MNNGEESKGRKVFSPQKMLSKAYLLPWYTTKMNVFIKGSKGSGKSYFAALWHIYNIMAQPHSSAMVVRKVGDTIADSCYQDLKRVIYDLGVENLWKCTMQPLKMVYIPTGQSIIFRGLDDPYKLASVTAPPGCYLCWVWFEEAFDITNYDDVLKIQASIRAIPEWTGLKKRFTFTFNPWNQYHWLKEEIFDKNRDDSLTLTTTYLDNPGFKAEDRKWYEDLEKYNPIAARVIVHGEWGVSEGLIYNNWNVEHFNPEEIAAQPDVQAIYGLDFGYAVSFTAFVAAYINVKTHDLWVYDEVYEKGMTNLDIAKRLTDKGYAHAHIIADCAEPKSIYELKEGRGMMVQEGDQLVRYYLPNIEATLKGRDSVSNGIQRIQTFRIHVHPRCTNTAMELSAYAWKKDKDGKYTGEPEKEHDHIADALRYSVVMMLRSGAVRVAVAKGNDNDSRFRSPMTVKDPTPPTQRCKRVASTHE